MNDKKVKELAYLLNEENGFKLDDKVAWGLAEYYLMKQNFYKGKRCPQCGHKHEE